jgi:hypothetical protein
MATYSNLPGGFIYDLGRDGTVTTNKGSGGTLVSTMATGDMDSLAGWTLGAKKSFSQSTYFVALFPQQRAVTAVACSSGTATYDGATLQYSIDTTDGYNGTWVTIATIPNGSVINSPNALRSRIFTVGQASVRAVRIANGGSTLSLEQFAVWGTTLVNGLLPWHPTLDQPLSNDTGSLDRGDILITASPLTQQFRVKNNTVYTAGTVTIGTQATAIGSLDTETVFSLDGTNFQATQAVATIAAGAISGIIHMKRPQPSDVAGTTRIANVIASAATWT